VLDSPSSFATSYFSLDRNNETKLSGDSFEGQEEMGLEEESKTKSITDEAEDSRQVDVLARAS
jgi:hypothetical protein